MLPKQYPKSATNSNSQQLQQQQNNLEKPQQQLQVSEVSAVKSLTNLSSSDKQQSIKSCAELPSFKPEHFIQEKPNYIHGYTKEESLGKGSFGEVHKVRSKFQTEEIRAIKQFAKEEIPPNQEHEYLCEIEVLKKFDHPNILKIYEFYQDSTNYYMITEYCQGGALDALIEQKNKKRESEKQQKQPEADQKQQEIPQNNILQQSQSKRKKTGEKEERFLIQKQDSFLSDDNNNNFNSQNDPNVINETTQSNNSNPSKFMSICNFDEKEAACIMKQLFSAILYAHRRGIVHRDLKPANIMIDFSERNNYFIKVIDWGLAGHLKEGYLAQECGTLEYQAPEVISGDEQYNEKCDVWSCGIILYQLFSEKGKTPFEVFDKDDTATRLRIFSGFQPKTAFQPERIWNQVSQECKDFITAMLTTDYKLRPAAEECLKNKWFDMFGHVAYASKRSVQSHFLKMKKFNISFKLQQAVLAFICSQLINKQENQRLMKVFKHLDKNNDGVLSREELVHCYKQCFSAPNSSNNTAVHTVSTSILPSANALGYINSGNGNSNEVALFLGEGNNPLNFQNINSGGAQAVAAVNNNNGNNDQRSDQQQQNSVIQKKEDNTNNSEIQKSQSQQDLDQIELLTQQQQQNQQKIDQILPQNQPKLQSENQLKNQVSSDSQINYQQQSSQLSQNQQDQITQNRIPSINNKKIDRLSLVRSASKSSNSNYIVNSPQQIMRKCSSSLIDKMHIIRKLSSSLSNVSDAEELLEANELINNNNHIIDDQMPFNLHKQGKSSIEVGGGQNINNNLSSEQQQQQLGEREHRDTAEIEQEVNQILQNVDLDNNGFIDYSEFVCACTKIQSQNQEKYLKQAFDMFDINKNGLITFQELKSVLGQNLNDIDENIWHEIIDEADQDGDKQISFEEFKQLMQLFTDQE